MSTPVHDEAERRRLAWRCRRGMKELDMLLLEWLARRYGQASPAQRALFATLLTASDPQLARWLIGGERPQHVELAALIDAIVFRAMPPVATTATVANCAASASAATVTA